MSICRNTCLRYFELIRHINRPIDFPNQCATPAGKLNTNTTINRTTAWARRSAVTFRGFRVGAFETIFNQGNRSVLPKDVSRKDAKVLYRARIYN